MLKAGREKSSFLSLQGVINKSAHGENTRNSFGTSDMIKKVYFIQQVIIAPADIC